MLLLFFFFKQKTAYEMRISDWSSDVCSSDLMKTQIVVLLAASVLALSACKNETPTAQEEAAEAQSAMEQAGDSAAAAMSDAGDAIAEGTDAAAAATGEAASEVADATQAEIGRAHV